MKNQIKKKKKYNNLNSGKEQKKKRNRYERNFTQNQNFIL